MNGAKDHEAYAEIAPHMLFVSLGGFMMIEKILAFLKRAAGLLVSVLIAEGVGALSVLAAGGGFDAYASLTKPVFAPPGWVFFPVWTVLYALMGWAAYRVWRSPASASRMEGLIYYVLQLVLNFLWPVLFFGLSMRGIAFIELASLFILVLMTMERFYKADKLAGWLMAPYAVWTAYALVLNGALWFLNQ